MAGRIGDAWSAESGFALFRLQRALREMTRCRTKLVQERARVANRVQKLFEEANIKLSSAVTDVIGVPARTMLAEIAAEQVVHSLDLTAHLPQIPAPTLAVFERQNTVVQLSDSHLVNQHLSDRRQVLIDRCGHFPTHEQPQQT